LPKMIEEPNWFALQLRVNPLLDPLRSDSRFEKMIAPLGDAEHAHRRSTSS